MKKSSVVIVEHDPKVTHDLKLKLPRIGCDIVGVFADPKKAFHKIPELNPELALVDLDLEAELSGIETAARIREVSDIPVVYLAQNPDRNMLEKSRHTHPDGFLINPFHEEEARVIIENALQKHSRDLANRRERDFYLGLLHGKKEDKFIFIKSDYKIRRIELKDICYIEALKDYVSIHTFDQVYTTHISMKDILRTLPDKDFVRIHRSYIVRIDKIFSIKYPELIIEGMMINLPMGGLYKKDVYERLKVI